MLRIKFLLDGGIGLKLGETAIRGQSVNWVLEFVRLEHQIPLYLIDASTMLPIG